jgi:hypothetical protein
MEVGDGFLRRLEKGQATAGRLVDIQTEDRADPLGPHRFLESITVEFSKDPESLFWAGLVGVEAVEAIELR